MRKILIVGAGIIDKQHAAGITVRSIIDGIKPECVMGLVWGETGAHMKKTAIKLRKLSYKKLSPARVFDNAGLKKASHTIKKAEIIDAPKQSIRNKTGFIRSSIKYLRQWIALIPARSTVELNRADLCAIKEFKPEVIYTVGESVATLRLAYQISIKLDIPIVIHFMDNWKNSIEWADNPLLRHYQKNLSRYCKLCYTRTNECIAISDRMAEAYEQETGVKHSVIMNSIDTQKFYCQQRNDDGVIRFVYAGGLHLGRDKALRNIGECIDRLCDKEKKVAEFSIYTSACNIDLFSKQFENLTNTRFHLAIPHEQICELYRNSDVLIHVESSELHSNEFFKYSISTKISEYLATGRPFLFYGPENIYLFHFLRNNQLSYTASDEGQVEKILKDLIEKKDNVFSKNARTYAQTHYDIIVAQQKFIDVIERVGIPN